MEKILDIEKNELYIYLSENTTFPYVLIEIISGYCLEYNAKLCRVKSIINGSEIVVSENYVYILSDDASETGEKNRIYVFDKKN